MSDDPLVPREKTARLVLADGTVIEGVSFGAAAPVAGEVVFNTGMVGYPEALTDPSYRGQILVLTYPLVGNYGVPDPTVLDEFGLPRFFEGERIHIAGLVVAEYSEEPSHWNSVSSLGEWLAKAGVPAMCGVDTRALTKRIREHGALLGKIEFVGLPCVRHLIELAGLPSIPLDDPNKRNLVAEVSTKVPRRFALPREPGDTSFRPRVAAIDCGIKYNIIRYLARKGLDLTVLPYDHDFTKDAPGSWDGIFISNGPGDPSMCGPTIASLKTFLASALATPPAESRYNSTVRPTPVFGICLGNQLLALAAGAKTYKMKYGNRGMNQPAVDMRTTRCYITPQNHGFAVDPDSLPRGWKPFFVNANDSSNEGIIHEYLPFFSVQFHPEANGGPLDTEFLFDMFLAQVAGAPPSITTVDVATFLSRSRSLRRVLLLGSGGLSIGQAGEFDYSGSQAIKALKEEGVEVVLVNPNIATVQTSKGMADRVYFLPVDAPSVLRVLEKERPDGILISMGGQTALNVGLKLHDDGHLARLGCRVLGTPVSAVKATEDRELFARLLAEIGETVAQCLSATNVEDAVVAAGKIGYPVLVRAAYALGGLGSGFAEDPEAMRELATRAFVTSDQILIDKDLRGWKEIEYEVVRDANNNCVTVCNMENFDPLGVHTGDSIVVAPSQTLSNTEYFKLRSTALKVVRHLGVIGECNIQYALHPDSERYCIIEVNARLSRSSALASKATGYPLAYVATKLALGHDLVSLRNSVTKTTTACFEPSLDYVVVKVPRWDLKKFGARVDTRIGSAMKSVGEVMAIGRTFEEAIQKAVRMVNPTLDGFAPPANYRADWAAAAVSAAAAAAAAAANGAANANGGTSKGATPFRSRSGTGTGMGAEGSQAKLVFDAAPSASRAAAGALGDAEAAATAGAAGAAATPTRASGSGVGVSLAPGTEARAVSPRPDLAASYSAAADGGGPAALDEGAAPPRLPRDRLASVEIFGGDAGAEERLFTATLDRKLRQPADTRLFDIAVAFDVGYSVDRVHELTRIDRFFLGKLKRIADMSRRLQSLDSLTQLGAPALSLLKRAGFGDKQIGRSLGVSEVEVRRFRKAAGVLPVVKQIDTLAAEFPAQTNYLYMTYNGDESDVARPGEGVMVLGCGPYCIGSSVEFDWCAVSCTRTLRSSGVKTIVVNCNPETVSTDYDESDRLYFEELSVERVIDIYEAEGATGVIVSVGGQIPNNLAMPLHRQGVNVLGTSPVNIDVAEDRNKFSRLLDTLGVDQPPWRELSSLAQIREFAAEVGFPVLVRPSYVLSGAAMRVATNEDQLRAALTSAAIVSPEHPVVVSKFIVNAKEIEFDAVAKNGVVLNYAISEHVENAGVHSGDATLVLPAQKLYVETIRQVKRAASAIARALNISGPFNMQFMSRENEVKVIECNLRASRTFPFISKTFDFNFITLATKVMAGLPCKPGNFSLVDLDYVGIKAPQFSFARLQGADPTLGVEMMSTGEVACFGPDMYEAFLLAIISAGFKLPLQTRNILVSVGSTGKPALAEMCARLQEQGFHLFATEGTKEYLEATGPRGMAPITLLHKPRSGRSPNVTEYLQSRKLDLVINDPESSDKETITDGYLMRRTAVDFGVSLLTNIKCAVLLSLALQRVKPEAPSATGVAGATGGFHTLAMQDFYHTTAAAETN